MIYDLSNIPFSLFLTIILGLGIIAQWIAWRFKFPSILLLLGFGFGASQLFGISIDNYLIENVILNGSTVTQSSSLLLPIVGLSVAIILFEGGLTLKFSELKESGVPVLRLCTIAVAISFALTTAIGIYVFDWNWRVAAILGSILVVTGPTVIAPLLRHIQPTRKVGSIVKWEGIVVDPIGAILAVLVFQAAISPDLESAKSAILLSLGKTIGIGVVLAYVLAKVIEILLRRHLIPDFLHSIFIIAIIAIAFTASNAVMKELGLLTITVMGIALANQKTVSVKHILEFKEHLRTLIISLLFLILSGRIHSGAIGEVFVEGLLFLCMLIVIVRPLSIFIANLGSKKVTFKEQLFLSALAPRGIVAAAVISIFALELEHASHDPKLKAFITPEIAEQAATLVPIVFIIIIGTVAFYGLLASPFAKMLGLAAKNPSGILFAGANAWTRAMARELQENGHDVLMLDTNYSNVAAAKIDGLPAIRANILSEYVEELDLNGINQLIAGTRNDEVNSLACKEFAHIFGSANIWQVAPRDDNAHHTNAVSHKMRGRITFSGRPKYEELDKLIQQGAVIKTTTISEQYTFETYKENNPQSILLFLDSEDKGIRPAGADLKKVAAGTKVYALVHADAEQAKQKKQAEAKAQAETKTQSENDSAPAQDAPPAAS